MKSFMKKICIVLMVAVLTVNMSYTPVSASRNLTKSQKEVADTIAKIAIDNWDKYGVLPSTAVTQAFIESTLGDRCRGYNLWGIRSGAVTYSSLYEGTISYLKVINNGYYKDAPFKKDYKIQLRKILDGGYCQPEGKYYSNALWSINTYKFYNYDKELFKQIEKKKACLYDAGLEAFETTKENMSSYI